MKGSIKSSWISLMNLLALGIDKSFHTYISGHLMLISTFICLFLYITTVVFHDSQVKVIGGYLTPILGAVPQIVQAVLPLSQLC